MSVAGWGGAWGGAASASGYATPKIPVFRFYSELLTVGSTNNTITFGEGGGALTATVESGTWSYGGDLPYKIKVALEAAGAGTYTVSYSHATRKFTIVKDSGTFTLDAGGNSNDFLDDIGFTSDASGALTYTSDTAVPSQTTLTCTTSVKGPQYEDETRREDFDTDAGIRTSAFHGDVERYTFRLEHETVAVAQGFFDMWHRAGKYGLAIDYYPDSTDLTNFVTVFWDAKTFRPREMTAENLYRLYAIDIPLRFKKPAGSSTHVPKDFIDRRPSS